MAFSNVAFDDAVDRIWTQVITDTLTSDNVLYRMLTGTHTWKVRWVHMDPDMEMDEGL